MFPDMYLIKYTLLRTFDFKIKETTQLVLGFDKFTRKVVCVSSNGNGWTVGRCSRVPEFECVNINM